MSLVVLVIIAIALPLLLIGSFWRLFRVPRTAARAREESPRPSYTVGGETPFIHVGFFAFLGASLVVVAVVVPGGRWLSIAVATYFFVKSAFLHFLFRVIKAPVRSGFILLPNHWRILAAGSLLSATFSFASAALEKGVLAWVFGFFTALLAAFYAWASYRARVAAA